MSESKRIKHRFDISNGKTVKKNYTNSELVSRLKNHGLVNPTGNQKKLVDQCISLGIPVKYTKELVSEGWVGKAKGALQVLFERGWINPDKIHLYTCDCRKGDTNGDATGCNISTKRIMKLQNDFINEVTLLQFYGEKMGIVVDRTPKCHPEIARKGIEYGWAIAKIFPGSQTSVKRRHKFRNLVRRSTCPDTSLASPAIQGCSKKACIYMKLYKAIQSIVLIEDVVNQKYRIMEDTVKLYSRMKKKEDPL